MAKKYASEQEEIDAIFERAAADNKRRYAKEPQPKPEDVASMAKFLKRWARGRAITKFDGDGQSFWARGKNMTQLSPKMVDALVEGGFATKSGARADMRDWSLQMR